MATTTNGTTSSLAPRDAAPSVPGQPYVLRSLGGETIYIPCSLSATRMLVTGKETSNAFAVVGTGGIASPPIGFHYHHDAHDVFLCLKGRVTVWADDEARTLGPGDLASVPPRTVHSYQILGPYSEFVGLIVPGGWEEFFRAIGDVYDGPLFPTHDPRNPFEVLIPRLKRAAEEFDMVPVPMHKGAEPRVWIDGRDDVLPGSVAPYFLRAGAGPRYLVGGTVCAPMVGVEESGGRFEIGSIEGTGCHGGGEGAVLERPRRLVFADVHHALQVADGAIEVTLDDDDGGSERTGVLQHGETIYIPKGTGFSMRMASRFAKAYVFCSGKGLIHVLSKAGEPYTAHIPPETPAGWDEARIRSLEGEVGFRLSS